MRNMAFSLTESQFVAGTKTVTRRLGWKFLKPGDQVRAVRQAQGLKKGEKVHVLGIIKIVSVRRELLDAISLDDVDREGFAGMWRGEFVEMFRKAMRCQWDSEVTRIEFRKLATPAPEVGSEGE